MINLRENDQKKKADHQCRLCSKIFAYNSSLIKHMRVHTGEKPYLCSIEGCFQRFSQISNLIRHKRVHSGLRPFKCNKCSKSFGSSCNLKQHTKIHNAKLERSKFFCFVKDCHESYLYICTLKKHMIRAHRKFMEEFQQALTKKSFYQIYKEIKNKKNSDEKIDVTNFREAINYLIFPENSEKFQAAALENEFNNNSNNDNENLMKEIELKRNKKIFVITKIPKLKKLRFTKKRTDPVNINFASSGQNELSNINLQNSVQSKLLNSQNSILNQSKLNDNINVNICNHLNILNIPCNNLNSQNYIRIKNLDNVNQDLNINNNPNLTYCLAIQKEIATLFSTVYPLNFLCQQNISEYIYLLQIINQLNMFNRFGSLGLFQSVSGNNNINEFINLQFQRDYQYSDLLNILRNCS